VASPQKIAAMTPAGKPPATDANTRRGTV